VNSNPPDPWVIVGRIGRTVGLDGSVRVWQEADLAPIFDKGVSLSAWSPEKGFLESLEPLQAREDGHGWVVHWKGYDLRESSGPLRNAWIVVQREDLPDLEEGLVYHSDLLGARVRTRDGREVGVAAELVECLAHDVVAVHTPEGKEFLLPLSREVDADLIRGAEAGEPAILLVNLPEGIEEAAETPKGEPKPQSWRNRRYGRRK
jgi:16S rRNA processing protein RimM